MLKSPPSKPIAWRWRHPGTGDSCETMGQTAFVARAEAAMMLGACPTELVLEWSELDNDKEK